LSGTYGSAVFDGEEAEVAVVVSYDFIDMFAVGIGDEYLSEAV